MKQYTADARAARIRAYELFLSGDPETGKRLSLRAIGQRLGMSHTTITYWKREDRWLERVQRAGALIDAQYTRQTDAIQTIVRDGIARHLQALSGCIDAEQDPERKAKLIVFFVQSCGKLKDIDPKLLDFSPDNDGAQEVPEFEDDIEDGLLVESVSDRAAIPVTGTGLPDSPDQEATSAGTAATRPGTDWGETGRYCS